MVDKKQSGSEDDHCSSVKTKGFQWASYFETGYLNIAVVNLGGRSNKMRETSATDVGLTLHICAFLASKLQNETWGCITCRTSKTCFGIVFGRMIRWFLKIEDPEVTWGFNTDIVGVWMIWGTPILGSPPILCEAILCFHPVCSPEQLSGSLEPFNTSLESCTWQTAEQC